MSIKRTLLSTIVNYNKEAINYSIFNNVEGVLTTNAKRYMGSRSKINSRHPMKLLAMALRRHFMPGMSELDFLYLVYDNADTIAKEAGIYTDSSNGRTEEGWFFGDNSLTSLVMTKLHPLELTGDNTYFHIISGENKSLLGISPLEGMIETRNISTIVIDLITYASGLWRGYLVGLEPASEGEEVIDNKAMFDAMVYKLIAVDPILSYHRKSMFNRYIELASGGCLTQNRVKTPFSSPNYVPDLNKIQVTIWDKVSKDDWRKAFSQLTLSKGYTVLNLLEDHESLTLPINQGWMSILNELQWAELYIYLGGDNRGIDSQIRRYIKDVEQDSLLSRCNCEELKYLIIGKMSLISTMLDMR